MRGKITAVIAVTASLICVSSVGAVGKVETVAGTGHKAFNGDRPVKGANISPWWAMEVNPNTGELYFIDKGNARIRKINKQTNRVETVAGTGSTEFNGDGKPREVNVEPNAMVFDQDGTLYFSDGFLRIRRLSSDAGGKRIDTLAGTDQEDYNGDGEASKTNINPGLIKIHPQSGEIYFTDAQERIRRCSRDGQIITVAGNGIKQERHYRLNEQTDTHDILEKSNVEFTGSGPALETAINPSSFQFHPTSNEIYFIDANCRICKIDTDGQTIETVAGTGHVTFNDDGKARKVNISATGLIFDSTSGELYFRGSRTIRKVTADHKYVETVAGTMNQKYNGDGPALEVNLDRPLWLTIDGDTGELYFVDNDSRIRKLTADRTTVETVAGTGITDYNSDGVATDTNINANLLYKDPTSRAFYFFDGEARIRLFVPDSNKSE